MFGFFEGPKCPKCKEKIDKNKKYCPKCGIYIVENKVSKPFKKSDFPNFKCIHLSSYTLRNDEYPILYCDVKHRSKSSAFFFTNQRVWIFPIFTFSLEYSFEAELNELIAINNLPEDNGIVLIGKNGVQEEIIYDNKMETGECLIAMQQALSNASSQKNEDPVNTKQASPNTSSQKNEDPVNTKQASPIASSQKNEDPVNTKQASPIASSQKNEDPVNTKQASPNTSSQKNEDPVNTKQASPIASSQKNEILINLMQTLSKVLFQKRCQQNQGTLNTQSHKSEPESYATKPKVKPFVAPPNPEPLD